MDHADTPRQADFDGRGNLSERALIEIRSLVLKVSELFELDNVIHRLREFVARHETLKPESARLLDETLVRGEIERGDASRITGLPERSARRVLNDLVNEGILASGSPKGPVSLRFPTSSLETLFPRLYPQI